MQLDLFETKKTVKPSGVIYQPKGAAGEYSALATNYYMSCSHGCQYCYCPGMIRKTKEDFFTELSVKKNYLKRLSQDAKKIRGDIRPVLLCFVGDPYQHIEKEYRITRSVLEIFRDNEIRPQILTKAGFWSISRDADLLQETNGIWAATLTTDSNTESIFWEPGAALPDDRIAALKKAKEYGLETWVSFEPVINPAATLRLIERVRDHVDVFKVGKLNNHPLSNKIDWKRFYDDVLNLLTRLGVAFYIKDDLRQYGDDPKP